MEIDGMSEFEQVPEGLSLRDVESEKLIVVEMARGHGVDSIPSAEKSNCSERDPIVNFNEP
jgi:hypothetical protein